MVWRILRLESKLCGLLQTGREQTVAVNINYGPAAGQTWESNENFEIRRQENMYQPQQGSGFMVYANAATQRQTVFYMNGDSRWMPASVFNGIGFETYHQHSQWSPRS